MLPVMARNILESTQLLAATSRLLADRCVDGIEADEERCRDLAEGSPSIVTPLNRFIGYEAAAVVKQSVRERPIRDVVVDRGHIASGELTEEQLDEALDVLGWRVPSAVESRQPDSMARGPPPACLRTPGASVPVRAAALPLCPALRGCRAALDVHGGPT